MAKIEISDYFSDDGSKKAVVFKQDRAYGIDFYESNVYSHSLIYNNKPIEYLESVAENYVLGVSLTYGQFLGE